MINNIINYIYSNKVLLVTITLIILYIILRKTNENMENIQEIKQELKQRLSLKDIVSGEKLNFFTTIDSKKYYLTAIPKKECFDMKYVDGGNCGNNLLVLMEDSHVDEIRKKFNTINDDKEALCNFNKHRLCEKEAKDENEKSNCSMKYDSCKQNTFNIDQFYISDKSLDKDTLIYNINGSPYSFEEPSINMMSINKYTADNIQSDRVCIDIPSDVSSEYKNVFISEVSDEKDDKLQVRIGFKLFETENNKIKQNIYYFTQDSTNICTVNGKKTYQVFLTKDINKSLIFEPEKI